jgi:hypothetical protein
MGILKKKETNPRKNIEFYNPQIYYGKDVQRGKFAQMGGRFF